MAHCHVRKLVRPSQLNKATAVRSQAAFLLLSALLITLISSTVTYAWISKNHKVELTSGDMSYDINELQIGGVKINEDEGVISLVTPGEATTVSTSDSKLIPGSVLKMTIGIANSSYSTSVTGIGFQETVLWEAGTSAYDSIDKSLYDEIPTEAGKYLGTQLYISVDTYTIYNFEYSDVLDQNGNPIMEIKSVEGGNEAKHLPLKTDGDGQPVKMTPVQMTTVDGDSVEYTEIIRHDIDISLGQNQLIAFDIVITFMDNGNQNDYQNFGNESATTKAKFSRTLAIITD